MPQVPQTYVDRLLTNVSVAYRNKALVADQIAPTIMVDKKTGLYFVYDKSNLRIEDDRRTGKSMTKEVDFGLTETSFELSEHALKHFITKDIMDQYDDPYDPMTAATNIVSDGVLLAKENALATDMANTAIMTQNTTLSGTDQWSDFNNSDPFDDIQTAIDTVKGNGIVMPNTLVLGYQVWSKLKNHPDLIERVKYSQLGSLTTALLADLFDIPNVIIGGAVKNTAKEGQTDSLSYVWGKHAWVMYVPTAPALESVASFYTLTLKNGRYIDRWDEKDPKGTYVRANDYYDHKLVAAEAAYLIKNAVA